jgi:hypothetical protein
LQGFGTKIAAAIRYTVSPAQQAVLPCSFAASWPCVAPLIDGDGKIGNADSSPRIVPLKIQ